MGYDKHFLFNEKISFMKSNCYVMHNFIWRKITYYKSTFYLVSKNTKDHFSQKARVLGFH